MVRDRQRPAADRAHLVGDGLAVVELAAGDHHVSAAFGEGQDHLPAEATAATSDDGHAAGQIERISHGAITYRTIIAGDEPGTVTHCHE